MRGKLRRELNETLRRVVGKNVEARYGVGSNVGNVEFRRPDRDIVEIEQPGIAGLIEDELPGVKIAMHQARTELARWHVGLEPRLALVRQSRRLGHEVVIDVDLCRGRFMKP